MTADIDFEELPDPADPAADAAAMLAECDRRIGPPPRRFAAGTKAYLRVKPPAWLDPPGGDGRPELRRQFERWGPLMTRGVVRWGRLVMANRLMFLPDRDRRVKRREPGGNPGVVCYPTAPPASVDPARLGAVTRRVQGLKNTTPTDPAPRRIADALTDELTTFYGWEVPPHLCGGLPCRISCVTFPRKHLPGGRLCGGLFPLLTDADGSGVVTVLPGRFWPSALRADWERSAAAHDAAPDRRTTSDEHLGDSLEEIAAGLGPPPRDLGGRWPSRKPWSLRLWRAGDELNDHFAALPAVKREGLLTWGQVTFFEKAVMEPGSRPRAAEVLWSPVPPGLISLEAMIRVAEALDAATGPDPPRPLRRIARLFRDRDRMFNEHVPPEFAAAHGAELPLRLTTTMLDPALLPGGRLVSWTVPVLVGRKPPHHLAVVPGRFWPAAIRDVWESNA